MNNHQFASTVPTEGRVESLPPALRFGDASRRGRNNIPFGDSAFEPRQSTRHPVKEHDGAGVEGLSPNGDAAQFESLLSESFG